MSARPSDLKYIGSATKGLSEGRALGQYAIPAEAWAAMGNASREAMLALHNRFLGHMATSQTNVEGCYSG